MNCIIWVVAVVVFFAGLYAVVVIPIVLVTLAVGVVWSILRFFLPFLPNFWDNLGESGSSSSNNSKRKSFDWGERTEADKHRDLVEHIRIQHMNEERNRR
jgi:hypothetical protein